MDHQPAHGAHVLVAVTARTVEIRARAKKRRDRTIERANDLARGEPDAAAEGTFIHVYVDRATRRPAPLPDALKTALLPLVISSGGPLD